MLLWERLNDFILLPFTFGSVVILLLSKKYLDDDLVESMIKSGMDVKLLCMKFKNSNHWLNLSGISVILLNEMSLFMNKCSLWWKKKKKHVKIWLACEKTNREVRDGNGTKSGSWVKLLNDRSLWQVTVKWAWCSVLICVGWTNNDQSLLIAGSDEREFIDNDNECR